jgi:ppGpp synthetase/RelA/SpoT-type nucleotidyltranferase
MPELVSDSTIGTAPGGSFDFDNHRAQAVQIYQRLRPLYEAFAVTVQDILIEALRDADIKAASVEARAKSLDSFGNKAAQASESGPELPKYPNPIKEITDLAGARVITFFLDTIDDVDRVIKAQFSVLERLDKSRDLLQEERLGYQSVHYLVELMPNRTALPEYARYRGLRAEIQLRTVLQHAWAEIEHDIQYKSVETIPSGIRRRFMALAGMLEIADREFQAVQKDDESLRVQARASVAAGQLDEVEITGDALKAYLDKKLGPDGRMRQWAYESTARMLKHLGFTNIKQVDQCIAPYDDDALSRAVHGGRQGQLSRFEDMVQAAFGESFMEGFPGLRNTPWWVGYKTRQLERIRATGVPVGTLTAPNAAWAATRGNGAPATASAPSESLN